MNKTAEEFKQQFDFKISHQILSLAGQAGLIVALAALMASWPIWHWFQLSGLIILLITALICFSTGVISSIALLIGLQQGRDYLATACLAASVIRLLSTVVLALIICLAGGYSPELFCCCTGGFYLLLLAWETKFSLKIIKLLYQNF